MKPSLLAVLGLLMPVCAHAANNNIKMVTYFPIPYVSYNELGVTKTCDLGLMDGCVLDSGSSLRVQKSTSDGALRLKEGTLSLSGPGVTGNRFVAGSDVISNSRIGFKHSLDVKSMTQSVQSLEVTNRAYLGELNLFGEIFPKCDNNNSREMTWKRLTINGKDGVFLVCGAGKEPEIEKYKFTPKTENIQAAGYCRSYAVMRNEAGNSSEVGGPRDTMGGYKFARSITQTSNLQHINCTCAPGQMPVQRSGVASLFDTQFTGELALNECPSGADADICNQNCPDDSPSCSFRCVKNIQVAGCGMKVETKQCYYNYASGCCSKLACFGRTDSCVDPVDQVGKACAESFYVDYEPKIGSAVMLSCVRQS